MADSKGYVKYAIIEDLLDIGLVTVTDMQSEKSSTGTILNSLAVEASNKDAEVRAKTLYLARNAASGVTAGSRNAGTENAVVTIRVNCI